MLVLMLVRSGTKPGPWIPCESTNTGRGRPSGNTRHHPQPSIRRPSSGTIDQFSHILTVHLTQAVDEIKDRDAGFDVGLEAAPVQQFAFERGEKALAHGVVEPVGD